MTASGGVRLSILMLQVLGHSDGVFPNSVYGFTSTFYSSSVYPKILSNNVCVLVIVAVIKAACDVATVIPVKDSYSFISINNSITF